MEQWIHILFDTKEQGKFIAKRRKRKEVKKINKKESVEGVPRKVKENWIIRSDNRIGAEREKIGRIGTH